MVNDDYLLNYFNNINSMLSTIKDVMLCDIKQRGPYKNPLNQFGNKVFSQTDEDGITLEIVRRLGINNGSFVEFGVGNGMENNTLILAALGWTGFWVDVERPMINLQQVSNPRFAMMTRLVTLDNILDTMQQGLEYTSNANPDFISFDFDGIDYYLVEKLLENQYRPSVFVVEYNAKFIPPIEWKIDYDPDNTWRGDDYFGASLASFAKLFEQHGYFLACCNGFTGANAYFIRNEHKYLFTDVPEDIRDIWIGPSYHLPRTHGHSPSPRTVESILNKLNS